MGNGQNKRRRGAAHGRQSPHRGGASVTNDRRSSQLVPSTSASVTPETAPDAMPDATTEAIISDRSADAIGNANSDADPRDPGETLAKANDTAADEPESAPPTPATPLAREESVANPPEPVTEPVTEPAVVESAVVEPAVVEPAVVESAVEPAEAPTAPLEPEQRAPRGRFERFYAPGQQPRASSNGRHGAAERNGKSAAPHAAESDEDPHQSNGRGRHAPQTTLRHTPVSEDEDDEALIASGPREDVRGAVGGLIDSLHDLFTRDRGLASQGGVSRCGICYLHYPLGELVYHEGEGFYICRTCERALGGARINMVRRQQRL